MSRTVGSVGIRRIMSGIGLIGFPALLVAEDLVDPTGDTTFYAAALTSPEALTYSALLLLFSAVLTVPAIGGLIHLARDRGAVLANLGAAFALLGALGHTALAVVYLMMRSLAGGTAADMQAYEDRLNTDPALGAVAMILLLSFGLGLALLAWAAWRTGLIGWWGPALVTAVVVGHNVLPEDLPSAVGTAALAALAVVFGWLGLRVLAMSDQEWNPEVPLKSSTQPSASTSVA